MYIANNLDPNFAGLNWYTWFIGRVVDIFDPEKKGKLRVRCFGFHSFNVAELPTEHLPWAQVMNWNTGIRINLGDIVIGYFTDRDRQVPVVYGKIEGIWNGEDVSAELTKEQIDKLPVAASNIYNKSVGKPTTSPLARGEVAGTAVNVANENVTHICDISGPMRNAAGWIRVKFSEFMTFIRNGIRAILTALGFQPDGVSSRLKQIAESVAREAKKLRKFLNDVNLGLAAINNYIRQVNQMIQWILSLPERVIALLADCLAELRRSLTLSFAELFKSSTPGGGDISAVSQAVAEVKATFNTAIETTGNIAATAASAAATYNAVTSASSSVKGIRI
jgi:hypothetical protein